MYIDLDPCLANTFQHWFSWWHSLVLLHLLQELDDPKVFTSFKERLCHLQVNFIIQMQLPYPVRYYILTWLFFLCSYAWRELKSSGCVLENLAYMDGVFLHVETFRKGKWYLYIYVYIAKLVNNFMVCSVFTGLD